MKKLIILCSVYFLSLPSFGAMLKLLARPEPHAPVITQVESGDELIAIFKPENSRWIKVADPRNGKVGWVEKAQLNLAEQTQPSKVNKSRQGRSAKKPKLFHKKIDKKHHDQHGNITGHDHVEYYGTQNLSDAELQNMIHSMRRRQMRMMRDMHRMMNDLYEDSLFTTGIPSPSPKRPNPQNNTQQRPDRITVPKKQDTQHDHIR